MMDRLRTAAQTFSPPPISSSHSPSSSTSSNPPQIVYRDTMTKRPPPCPEGYTRFVLISDTHTHKFPVPNGDILLHAGDLTEYGDTKELKYTVDWLCGMPHKYKVFIAGNHDYCLDKDSLEEQFSRYRRSRSKAGLETDDKGSEILDMYTQSVEIVTSKTAKDAGLIYLKDEVCELPRFGAREGIAGKEDGESEGKDKTTWKIWGSPWSAAFCSMAFNIPRGDASAELYSDIPDDIDILMTHGPPHGILDRVRSGNRSVGCENLLERTKAIQPRLHVWGHIHEDRGVVIGHGGGEENSRDDKPPTVFVNAANAGTFARPRVWGTGEYQPIVIDLKDEVM